MKSIPDGCCKSSEGRFWGTACRGTSIIDITANFGDIFSKTCPAVCERNTWSQCFHITFFFLFPPRPYPSTAYTSSRLYQTCVSPTLDVWKELTVFALTKDVSTCMSGRGNINCLNLILVYPGQAVMDLLALISFSPPIMWTHLERPCAGDTFMEVDTAWQRWRSVPGAVALRAL